MPRSENVIRPYEDRQDEDLLATGRYHEWFYKGLSPKARAFINVPVKKPVIKPDSFTISGAIEYTRTKPKRWADKMACTDVDPGVFFPSRTNGYLDPKATWRRVCPTCPIREECLEFGLEINQNVSLAVGNLGIFGGKLLVKPRAGGPVRAYDEHELKPQGRPRKKQYPKACSVGKHVLMTEGDLNDDGECRQCTGDYSIGS